MQHKIELKKVTIVKAVITALLEELHKLRTFCGLHRMPHTITQDEGCEKTAKLGKSHAKIMPKYCPVTTACKANSLLGLSC